MDNNIIEASAVGKYYWELVFDYDNTGTNASVMHEYTKTTKKEINRKQFMSSKFSTTSSWTFKQEVSAKLSYEGLEAGSTSSFGYHTEIANELVNTSETRSSESTQVTEKSKYEIPANSRLALYQLHFITDGVTVITDVVSNILKPDVSVTMKFKCLKRILGIDEILNQFLSTNPGSSNRDEWDSIRNSIVSNSTLSDEGRFKEFVKNLNTINPARDNINEWARIRTTCSEVLKAWDDTDKQLLFLKLLNRFLDINPSRDNKDEWAAIRNVANDIKSNVKVAR